MGRLSCNLSLMVPRIFTLQGIRKLLSLKLSTADTQTFPWNQLLKV